MNYEHRFSNPTRPARLHQKGSLRNPLQAPHILAILAASLAPSALWLASVVRNNVELVLYWLYVRMMDLMIIESIAISKMIHVYKSESLQYL